MTFQTNMQTFSQAGHKKKIATAEHALTKLISLETLKAKSKFLGATSMALVLAACGGDSSTSIGTGTGSSTDTGSTDTADDDAVVTTGSGTSRVDSFEVLLEAGTTYVADSHFGNIAATTAAGNVVTFTSATGGADTISAATLLAGSLRSDSVTLTADAALADGMTITGTSNSIVNSLEGDAAADLSNITVTGTRTANVTGDVIFTGDLGTFSTVIADTNTLTAAAGVVDAEIISGEGNITVTALTAATDISNFAMTGTVTVSGVAAAAQLTTLDGITAVKIEAEAITAISGTVTEAAAVVTAHGANTIAIDGNYTLDVSGTATAAQLDALDTDTSGAIDARDVTAISGTVAAVTTELAAGATFDTDFTLDVSGTATAAELKAFNTATSGAVDIQDVTTITMANTGVTIDLSDAGFTDGTAAFTVTGGSGADTITGGAGVDTITSGGGADTITGGLGADLITLSAAGDVETIVMTTGGAIAVDEITDFIVAGGEDELQVDLSDLNGINAGTLQLANNSGVLAAGATNTLTVTALASAAGDYGAAASSLVTITGATAYTEASLETAIEAGGTGVGLTAGDSILIMYDDTSSSYLALLTDNAGENDGTTFSDVTITNLLEFTDIGAAESFLTTSFAIIT